MSRNKRENILKEIDELQIKQDRIFNEIEKLKRLNKKKLAVRLEKTEYKQISYKILNKWEQYTQSLQDDYGNKILSINDLYSMKIPEQSWVVDRLVPSNGITAISGTPGSYKSWLSIYIAKEVSRGEQVFGKFDTDKSAVLVIDLENSIRLKRDRAKLLNIDSQNPIYYWKGDFCADQNTDIERLKAVIQKNNINLVIFDSLVRIHNKDENDAKSMSAVFKKLKEIVNQECTIIFLHHSRKQSFNNRGGGESMRGSSDILAAIDSHLLLEKNKDGLKISQPKLRQAEAIKPIKLKIATIEDNFDFIFEGEVKEPLDKITETRSKVVEVLKGGSSGRQELINGLKDTCGSVSVDKALKGLLAEKLITKQIGKRNKHIYSLVENETGNQISFVV